MGGRSKKSSTSKSSTVDTGALQSKGAAQQAANMASAFGLQKDLRETQLAEIMPAFAEMVSGAMGSFRENPAANFMGAMLGMPIQMDTPDFVSSFINKYKPIEPTKGPSRPTAPKPFDINEDMRERMGMGTPYPQYNTSLFGGQ